MIFRRTFLVSLVVCLATSGLQSAIATSLSGSACSSVNKVKLVNGLKFTCQRSGKKTLWSSGVKVKPIQTHSTTTLQPRQPEPSPLPSQTPTPPEPMQSPASSTTVNKVRKSGVPVQGESCPADSGDVVGYDENSNFVDLMCNSFDNRYFPRPDSPFLVDPVTGVKSVDPTTSFVGIPSLTPLSSVASDEKPSTGISDISLFASAGSCKIPDGGVMGDIPQNFQHHFVSGFSPYAERAKLLQNPVIQVVPMDFSDDVATTSPQVDLSQISAFISNFYQHESAIKLNITWKIPSKYIRAPQPLSSYDIGGNFFKGTSSPTNLFSFAHSAITAADPSIDFSGATIVALVFPPGTTNAQSGSFMAEAAEPGANWSTAEGEFHNLLIAGAMEGDPVAFQWTWMHEMTHMFGFTDVRTIVSNGNQDSSPMGVFDLMNSEVAPELLAWQRWLLGIILDDQVYCETSKKAVSVWLHPVEEESSNKKLLVLPISKYRAVIVESRRRMGFDSNLGTSSQGVLVYVLDTTAIYRTSPMTVIPRSGSTDNTWRTDSLLKPGDSVVIEGYSISVAESGPFGDVIKVSSAS